MPVQYVVFGCLSFCLSACFLPLHAAELLSADTVWTGKESGQPHNAFTDLIRFHDHWYLGCREALRHHGGLEGMGRLRVLRSKDGKSWESVGLFDLEEGDLRDAKLSITRDNTLMLSSAIQVYRPAPVKHKNVAWFSRDGSTWSEPVPFGEPDIWIWSVTWHDGVAYGVGYPTTPSGKNLTGGQTTLYRSGNGRDWEVLVRSFSKGNESAISFKPDGTAVCLMRSGSGIGQAKPPYKDWTWKGSVNLGGPDMVRLPDGRFIAGGRSGWGSMNLFEVDPETGRTKLVLSLPARGDSSYPGLFWHDDALWVSYYSSSKDATAGDRGDRYLVPCEVRLARVKLDAHSVLKPPGIKPGEQAASR